VRGGGSIFRKTPDVGLVSYSIIPLRSTVYIYYIPYMQYVYIVQCTFASKLLSVGAMKTSSVQKWHTITKKCDNCEVF
jgi:hypothetical protein